MHLRHEWLPKSSALAAEQHEPAAAADDDAPPDVRTLDAAQKAPTQQQSIVTLNKENNYGVTKDI